MERSWIPERRFHATLEEEAFGATYPSGFRAYVCRKPGFKRRYASYSAFYGSVDQEFALAAGANVKVPDGIAHYLEHVLFETPQGNASDIFAARGAYSNAATSYTVTSYLFESTGHFYENLDLLLDFVENPSFPVEKVEKERGIIEQEIQGTNDDPHWVGFVGLLENLFERHPIRAHIAGTVASIREISSDLLHECYRAFYAPSNMILCAVGDVDPEEFFDFVARRSKSARADGAPPRPPPARRYPEERPAAHRREALKAMDVALPKLFLGFKDVPAPSAGEPYVLQALEVGLALEILFGKSSPAYQELYEKGLILDDFGASYHAGAGVGFGLIEGDAPDPERLRQALLERIAAAGAQGIPPEDFERSKRNFLGGFIRAFNSLEYIARNYTFYRFHGFDLFELVDLVARIDREDMERRVRALLDPEKHAAYLIVPRG
ncbi:MAG: EF-P 5-aminopentanol modification-associated protein YfmH [Planctomycetota bacterium]